MATTNSINNRSQSLTTTTFVNAGTTITAGTGLTVTSGGAAITGNTIINGGTVGIGTDNAANAITIGTGTTARLINIGQSAAAHVINIGTTNTTSSMTVNSGTGNMQLNSAGTNTLTGTGGVTIQSTNTAIGITSGTGTVSISADATANALNLGTGAGAKVVTLGSTSGASSLALKYGTADFSMASATGNVMVALDTGEITYPLQVAFLATVANVINDVTGAGTTYTVIFDTEIYDQNGDFNLGTSTFTAPVTGRYHFSAQGALQGNTILTAIQNSIVTSNRAYSANQSRAASAASASQAVNSYADMDAADTATFTVTGSGEAADTSDIRPASASGNWTFWGGKLVA